MTVSSTARLKPAACSRCWTGRRLPTSSCLCRCAVDKRETQPLLSRPQTPPASFGRMREPSSASDQLMTAHGSRLMAAIGPTQVHYAAQCFAAPAYTDP